MSRKTAPFSTSELLDFEAQMTRDELGLENAAEARDAKLREAIAPSRDRIQTLRHWLDEMRKDPRYFWPRVTFQRSYSLLFLAALGSGVICGAGLMHGLLRYSGERPVNILPFLAVFVILQMALILLYILRGLLGRIVKQRFRGIWLSLLRDLSSRVLSRRLGAGQGRFARTYLSRLWRLHAPLFEAYLWKTLQVFGCACFGAALATFLANISVHDYSFGWGSTLSYQASSFYRFLEVLAWPFQWLWSDALPSRELVEASQFSRFERTFADPQVSSRETGAWWPFLACCVAFYALLPRVILVSIFEMKIRSYLRRLAFDDFMSNGLWQRLIRPFHWSSADAAVPVEKEPRAADLLRPIASRKAIAVRWRDCPYSDEEIRRFFTEKSAQEISAVVDAVGKMADGERISAALDAHKAEEILIVCDPWEMPGEAIERLRKQIRDLQKEKGRSETRMAFVPLAKKDGQLEIKGDRKAWRYAVGAFHDPYLGLLSIAQEEPT